MGAIGTLSYMFILSSANAFNLDQSKNLSFGEGLPLANNKIMDWTKLKAVVDTKLNVAEIISVLDMKENIVGKRENAGYSNVLTLFLNDKF